ncbi:hypothetical protein ACW14Y_05110 [Kitasatospora sp. cg17-2]
MVNMVNLKKACVTVAAAGILAGVLTGAPASAAPSDTYIMHVSKSGAPRYLTSDPIDPYGLVRTSEDDERIDKWILRTPPGAAADVYQLQLSDSNRCLKAVSNKVVELAECVANPGPPQRWKVTRQEDAPGTIESRMYPGQVLTDYRDSGAVLLLPTQEAQNDGLWDV